MKKGIYGKKLGMTQIFTEEGLVIPVTVVEVEPCVVIKKKTVETDGYNAIQVATGEVKEKHLNKAEKGQFDKLKLAYKKYIRELRLDDIESINVGDELKADIFAAGELVDVQGISKGKDSKVLLRDMDNILDQKDMVLCIIEDQVLWDLHLHQEECSQVKNYQDIQVRTQLLFKT